MEEDDEKCPGCGRGIYKELLKDRIDGKYCVCGEIIINERLNNAELVHELEKAYGHMKSEWKGNGRPDSMKPQLKALYQALRVFAEGE